MTSCLYCRNFVALLLFSLLSTYASGKILFKHCLGPIDLGGSEKWGDIQSSCIQEHPFEGDAFTWNLRNSVIRRSNFTNCIFADNSTHTQVFSGTTWKQVIFKGCRFSSRIPAHSSNPSITTTFEQGSFEDVVFDNCVFDSSVTLQLTHLALRGVTFHNCRFYGPIKISNSLINTLNFRHSRFGKRIDSEDPKSSRIGGDILVSDSTAFDIGMYHNMGDNMLRLQDVDLSQLEMVNSSLGSMACHEQLKDADSKVMKKVRMNNTIISNVTFSDSAQCKMATLENVVFRNLRARNAIDLSASIISGLDITNVHELDKTTCSTFLMEDAEVSGWRMMDLNTTKGSLARTIFKTGMIMPNKFISKTVLSLKETTFSQVRIGGECCSTACPNRLCLCQLKEEDERGNGICPAVPSSTRGGTKNKDCFPADALVEVMGEKGGVKRMEKLEHGDIVECGDRTNGSEVVFFGHRDAWRYAWYVELYASDGKKKVSVRLSGGHLLPVRRRGVVAARTVRVGEELSLGTGGWASVTKTRWTMGRGLFAPATRSGQMVVDGVVVSCFTEIVRPSVAQAALTPVRGLLLFGWVGRAVGRRLIFLHEWSGGDVVEGVGEVWGAVKRWMSGVVI